MPESIGQNDISSFIECNESNILEFEEINRALAHLISQKVELEKLNQLEKYEKNHAIFSNISNSDPLTFFINCLKSLYNMLELHEYEKMRRMILAFFQPPAIYFFMTT